MSAQTFPHAGRTSRTEARRVIAAIDVAQRSEGKLPICWGFALMNGWSCEQWAHLITMAGPRIFLSRQQARAADRQWSRTLGRISASRN